ncbi:hypothetical protein B9G55_21895 [Saccharibacillus sp. O16]|nr:hypothetical protein B9G55_21895 [Saccharibacillus sp. O16]
MEDGRSKWIFIRGGRIMNRKMTMKSAALLVLTTVMLTACTPGRSGETQDAGNKASGGDTQEAVVLRYANWNLGTEADQNLERRMIKAFEETHKNVTIKIDETITTDDWKASLATAASANKLPDVFMLNEIPGSVSSDWLLDLSAMASKDAEFSALPETVKQSTGIDGKTYAIPFAQHMMGYYVNKDIFNRMNLDVPAYGISTEDFVAAVKKTTDLGQKTVGLDSAQSMVDWYAASKNKDYGWFTYTDGKYHLDSPEMVQGMTAAKDLGSNGYAYEGLDEAQKKSLSGEDPGVAFRAGQIAFYWNGTWMNGIFAKEANFDWDFISIPSGRSALAADYLGIAKTTAHPEEAYEFAKWMSFGKEGFMKRISIADENGLELTSLPVTSDSEALDAYWELSSVPGIKKAYENLDSAMLDPIKIVPGYAASRWEAETGVEIGDKANATIGDLISASVYGGVNYQDYAKQLNDLAQKQYDEASAAMK